MPNMQLKEPDYIAISAMPADDAGIVLIQRPDMQLTYAAMLYETGAVSRDRFKTPHQVFIGIQACLSLGLNPILALRSCGFINGHFTLFSFLPMAVVRMSPKYKGKREYLYTLERVKDDNGIMVEKLVEQKFENNNLHKFAQGAVCELYRHDEEGVTRISFDMEDAKRAGLINSTPAWRKYPQIMLAHRARAQAINALFSDITNGVAQAEYDVPGVPEKPADMRLRHQMQTQALQALQQKMLSQQVSATQMDEVVVHDPFEGISSKDLRDVIKTPEAMAEFKRREAAYKKRMAEKVEAEAEKATPEERAEYEQEMSFSYDDAVKMFGGPQSESAKPQPDA